MNARSDVQRSVEALLADLWAQALTRVRIDARFLTLSPEALARLDRAGFLPALRSGRVGEEAAAAVLAQDPAPVGGTAFTVPGVRASIQQLNTVSYVRDFDVEIAQGSIVGDPIIDLVREGVLLDVRPHLLLDGGLFLEVLARTAALAEPIREARLEGDALGSVDLPAIRLFRVFTAGRIAPGESMAVLREEASGTVHVLLLTPRIVGTGPVRLLPVSALVGNRVGYRVTNSSESDDVRPERHPPELHCDEGASPHIDMEDLTDLLKARILSGARETEPLLLPVGHRLATQADPEIRRSVRRQLLALEAQATRTWRVQVRLLEVDGDGRPKLLGALRFLASAGRSVFPCVIGDPIVGAALTGFAVEVRPFLVDGGRTIALEAHLQLERLTGVDTVLTGARYLGAIELPASRTATALISGAVAPGEPLVTRFQSADGESVIRLVPTLEGEAAAGRLRLLEAGLAVLGPARIRLDVNSDAGVFRQWELDAAMERLVVGKRPREITKVKRAITPSLEGRTGLIWPIGGGDIATAGSEEFQAAAREKLNRVLNPLARSVRLEFMLRVGEEVLGRATLSALDGRVAFLRLGTDRSMIRDHDVEVGCYVQIADPIVTPVFSGWLIQATPRIAPDGKTITLVLDTRIQGLGAKPVRRELEEEVCGSLQVITMPSREIRSDLVLTAGETVSLASGRGRDGRPLVLEITCTR